MIVAAGGSVPAASTDSTNITSKNTALPNIKTTLLPPADLYGEMLTNSLLQAITPASSTDSFVSSSNETATSTNSNVAPVQNFATQLDPSCIAGLWGNGAQCGGLYYCTAGTAGGYWSSTACHLSE
jgi:hypothetical protein